MLGRLYFHLVKIQPLYQSSASLCKDSGKKPLKKFFNDNKFAKQQSIVTWQCLITSEEFLTQVFEHLMQWSGNIQTSGMR